MLFSFQQLVKRVVCKINLLGGLALGLYFTQNISIKTVVFICCKKGKALVLDISFEFCLKGCLSLSQNLKGCKFEHTKLSIHFESFNDECAILKEAQEANLLSQKSKLEHANLQLFLVSFKIDHLCLKKDTLSIP